METYIINGHEVEYETFDLVNIELFEAGVARVAETAKTDAPITTGVLRTMCYAMLDFFDELCGEGTTGKVFGGRINVAELTAAYRKFVADILEASRSLNFEQAPVADQPIAKVISVDRAMQREQRRAEAEKRVKAREKQPFPDLR